MVEVTSFDRLLANLPAIAEAVNRFDSEHVQEKAFEAAMRTFFGEVGMSTVPEVDLSTPGNGSGVAPVSGDPSAQPVTQESKRRRRSTNKAPQHEVVNVDLAPEGKESFRDFVGRLTPGNNDDRNVAILYYLREVANVSAITANHVFTCYLAMQGTWRIPKDLMNTLSQTASKKRWLDSSDRNQIILNNLGLNRAHDLINASAQQSQD